MGWWGGLRREGKAEMVGYWRQEVKGKGKGRGERRSAGHQ